MTWRPTRFRLGAMRERITVRTSTQDESTGQPIRSWATLYASEPAQWTPTSGGETVRGQSVEAGISAIATVHFRPDYRPEHQVVYNGNVYGVVYVKNVEGGRRYIELHLKSIDTVDRVPVTGVASASDTSPSVGTTVTISFTESPVSGNAFTYQWKKNGVSIANGGDISGATTATLQIANFDVSDDGTYTVEVTNTTLGGTLTFSAGAIAAGLTADSTRVTADTSLYTADRAVA